MKKVIAVDDNTTIIMLIKTKLTANGFEVFTAYNGENGIELIENENPDLVLLDIMMPKKDGFEVFNYMLSKDSLKNIPVVFLTASGQRENEEKAMQMGAKAYLTKPFSPNNLLDTVKEVLSQS